MADQPVTIEKLINADIDVDNLGKAVNEKGVINPRYGEAYPTLPSAIQQVIESGGFEPFATEAALKESVPTLTKKASYALDTHKIFLWENGAWTNTGLSAKDQAVDIVFSKRGKNLFDKSAAVAGEQYSPSSKKITTSSLYRRSGFIPVVAGQAYTLSGNLAAAANIAWYASNDPLSTAISHTTAKINQIAPAGANFALFNITNTGQNDTTYDATSQFEEGGIATPYEPFKKLISKHEVESLDQKLDSSEVFSYSSHNKMPTTKIDFVRRVSGVGFVADTVGAAASDWIPVIEGEWYTISGPGLFLNTAGAALGAYFGAYGQTAGLQAISFANPVDNNGKCFKVPTGLGITHVVINLKKAGNSPSATTLEGNVQLELGEIATPYQPYELKPYIKEELLKSGSGGGSTGVATLDSASWYKFVEAEGAKIHQDKLPNFRKAMLLKNEDVIIVNTGTSLTARTSEHCTLREDAAFRPPMMHSNAFCSHIWDALKWQGQEYRRYDSLYFAETGAFSTSSNLTEWDDGAYRDGLTRYSSAANAAVQFQIPAGAWQFNFIYRTDSVGCNAAITIASGNGQVEVFNESTSTWVEANGFTFSQAETVPVTRSVNVPNPVTGAMVATTLASKGNTTYQKRLKMRCKNSASLDSLADAKTVTIARTGGGARFMYWGVEWSPREFMITYINSARGSHKTDASSAQGLPRFADNEIWSFKPTLILSELGVHNDGASGLTSYQVGRFAGLAKNYVTNTDFELSMYSRATYFGLAPEYAFFTASTPLLVDVSLNGISADGSKLLTSVQTASVNGDAKAMTTLDKYQEAQHALQEENVICIDAAKRWIDAGFGIYGNLKIAIQKSSEAGPSMSSDGTHWNDIGGAVMAKLVKSLI